MLTDEEDALLVPPRRPDLLALQMQRLMDDKGLAEAVAHAGYEFVFQTLSWRRYAENMVHVFEGATRKAAAPHPASPAPATGAAPGHPARTK